MNKIDKQDEITRRNFLSGAARSYLGVSVLPMLGATLGTENAFGAAAPPLRANAAKSVIFLNMSGGMSHLDTFDPKPGAGEDVRGPTNSISTKGDGQLSEYLPQTAKVMNHICVINSMSTQQGAHEQGQYALHRGYAPRGTIVHPVLGSWVLRLSGRRNTTIPGFVSIGGNKDLASGGFMGAKYSGVPLGNPNEGLKNSSLAGSVTQEDFDQRLNLADALNKEFHGKFDSKKAQSYTGLYDEAVRLMTSEDLKAFDLSEEASETRSLYGGSSFGQGCLLARRLVEHQVRVVQVTLGGWDTHYDNFTSVPARCEQLDSGLAGLITDLERRGLLDSTIVVLGTEFGRTPKIVQEHQMGRDHYPRCYSALIAGGGVKAGRYGKSDRNGAMVAENAVSPEAFLATIGFGLGLPLERVIKSETGRPFWLGNKAKPLTELFS
ncbi:MAG: DUF1501 domain-containing protein [Verrucomicrobiota bacterium]